MIKRLFLPVLSAILLAGCTRPAGGVAPTELPLNFPSPAPGSTPFCQSADLGVSSNSIGATGALMLGITLTNNSKNPCALANPPQITLLDDGNKPIEIQIANIPNGDATPAPAQMELGTGESAILSLVWRNYCQPLPKDKLIVRLALAAEQNLDVAMDLLSEPRCDAKTEASTLTIAPYSYPP